MNQYPGFGHQYPYISPMYSGANVSQHAFMPYQPYSGQMMSMPMSPMQTPFMPDDCISQAEVNLLLTFRNLWEEHISWTRMAILALVLNQPNTNETVARLLRNAEDMGKALETIYGPRVGSIFRDLIRNHLMVAADLVKAAIAGDQAKFAELDKKWTDNGIAIARFLSKINTYIEFEEFRDMFLQHLEQTKNEAIYLIQQDYMVRHIRDISDYIAEATALQFPHM